MVVFQKNVSMFNEDDELNNNNDNNSDTQNQSQNTNNLIRRHTNRLLGAKKMSMSEDMSSNDLKLPIITLNKRSKPPLPSLTPNKELMPAPEPDWRMQILNQAAKDEVYLKDVSAYSSHVREEVRTTIKHVKKSIRAYS